MHPTTQALLEHIRDTDRQRIADANANESNLTKLAHADRARRMYGELVEQWCAAGFPDVPPEKHGRFVVDATEYCATVERWKHGVRVDTSAINATHLGRCLVLEHWRNGRFEGNLRVLITSQSADAAHYYDSDSGVSLTRAEWLVHPTTLELL